MSIIIDLTLLILLFAMLGIAADFAVRNIKYIATALEIKLFAFGIILGLVTTLPELSVGINATINNAAALSVGNLLSSVIVIFGLILGGSLLLNREVTTDGRLSVLLPEVVVILSPILLGWDGKYGLTDGLTMVGLYLGLIYYLYRANHISGIPRPEIINKNKIAKATLTAIGGVIFILLASHLIIEITLDLLDYIKVSKILIGALVFAIGTNLPEITITLTSWRKKTSELSLSHLLSSAFTNTLVLGVLATFQPINFGVDLTFWILAIFLSLIILLFVVFFRTGKKMTRAEGLFLLLTYVSFIIANFYLLK